ncbi:MAG TPA: DbpA RNA binding domain-containing protein [Gemmatimonadales bacterium]
MSLLSSLGWEAASPAVRDVVPSITRGNNLVVVVPPAPVYVTPTLAGLIERRAESGHGILVIAPAPGLGEWGALLASLTAGLTPPPLLALGPRQAERFLRPGTGASVLVASPATAVTLRQRSLIQTERIGSVLIAWPELWDDADALTLVLQDLPHEVQRVIVTADLGAVAPLVERHAWRAMTVGMASPLPEPAGPVMVVEVPWGSRADALPALAERLNVDSLAVWTADSSRHEELRRVLAGIGSSISLQVGKPAPAAQIIAFDPPTPDRLVELLQAGGVTLLAPPGTERWIARIAAPRQSLVLSGALDASNVELARRRALIERAVRDESLDEGFLALAPVFDQQDPASVAAALYQMWTRLPRPALAKQLEASTAAAPRSRIWVGAGKRDEVGVGDLVGLLINELRMERSAIGKIELRDTFALVEVPAPEADRIVQALSGRTLRKRRLVARVDRKP